MLTLIAGQVPLVARLIKRRLADVGISVNLVDHFSCGRVYCSRGEVNSSVWHLKVVPERGEGFLYVMKVTAFEGP